MVITCALRAQGPLFDPVQKHPFGVLFTENEKSNIMQCTELLLHQASFCSVVVMTCASHVQGPQFEPGRKHTKYVVSFDARYGLHNQLFLLFLPFPPFSPSKGEQLAHYLLAVLA